ncbi:hypothetical protein TWF506_004444 [Arthrobotrys conoides]|uniref:Uncharacterized protein n=1 Tax=Arthrobotrys conoides TaxID=74498 RepID=A0AAN8RIC8_9PEZI
MGRGSQKNPKKKSKASRRISRAGSSSGSSSGGRTPGRGGRANIVLKKQTSLRSASAGIEEYGTSPIPPETNLRGSEHQDNITPRSESSGKDLGWDEDIDTATQSFGEDTQTGGYEYAEMDSEGYEADRSGDAWSLNQLVRDGVHAIRDFVEGGMREARQYLPSPGDSQNPERYETDGVVEEPRPSSGKQAAVRKGREESTVPKENTEKTLLQPDDSNKVAAKEKTGLRMAGSRSSKDEKGGDKKNTNLLTPPPFNRRPTKPRRAGTPSRGGRGRFRPGTNTGPDVNVPPVDSTAKKPTEGTGTGVDGGKPKVPATRPKAPVDRAKTPPKEGRSRPRKKPGQPRRLPSPGRKVMRPDSPGARGRPTQMHAAKPPRPRQRGVLMLGDVLPSGMSLNQLRNPPGLNAVPAPPPLPGTPAINLVPPSEDSSITRSFISTDSLTPPEEKGWRDPKSRRPGGPPMIEPRFGKGRGPPGDPDTQLEPIFECPGCPDSGAMVVAVILVLIFTLTWVLGTRRKQKSKEREIREAKKSRLTKLIESDAAQKLLSRLPSAVTDKAAVVGTKLGGLGGLLKTVDEAVPISERVGFADPITMGREDIERATSVDHRAEVLKQLGLPKTASWEDISVHINGNKTTRYQTRKRITSVRRVCSKDGTCDSKENRRTSTRATLPPLPRDPKTTTSEGASASAGYRKNPNRDINKKTLMKVKPEKWGRKDWQLYTRIPSDIFWCPTVNVRECLPPGQDSDAAVADVLTEIERTLDYFGNLVKKQKEFRDTQGEKHTAAVPENRPTLPPTTTTGTSSLLLGSITSLPADGTYMASFFGWIGWLLSWFKGLWDYITAGCRGSWDFVNYMLEGYARWDDFIIRLGLAGGFIKRRYLQHPAIRGISLEGVNTDALAALVISKSIFVLQYWFPPLKYYINDHFFNAYFPGKVITILRAIIWYQLSTAQFLVVLMWPATIALRISHIFFKIISSTYRNYYKEQSLVARRGNQTDPRILNAMRQSINHMVSRVDLGLVEEIGGFSWLGASTFSGQWLLKWIVIHFWGFLKASCLWWFSVPNLIFKMMTIIASRELQRLGFWNGTYQIWREFVKPPVMLVVWTIFIARVATVSTIFLLYKSRDRVKRSVRRFFIIIGFRRKDRNSESDPKPPETPRRNPGDGSFTTPGGTRHPVPYTIDRKLLRSEHKVQRSLQVKFRQEQRLRGLRVMAAEARFNIDRLRGEISDSSTQASRAEEARAEMRNLQMLLDEIKVNMGQTLTRVLEATRTFQRSQVEYEQDQRSFSNGINVERYRAHDFRGDSVFKDLAPSEARVAIESSIRDMGIRLRGPRLPPSVAEGPPLVSQTVDQGTESTNMPPETGPAPNVTGTGPTATRPTVTGNQSVQIPPTTATPATTNHRTEGTAGEAPRQEPPADGIRLPSTTGAPPTGETRAPRGLLGTEVSPQPPAGGQRLETTQEAPNDLPTTNGGTRPQPGGSMPAAPQGGATPRPTNGNTGTRTETRTEAGAGAGTRTRTGTGNENGAGNRAGNGNGNQTGTRNQGTGTGIQAGTGNETGTGTVILPAPPVRTQQNTTAGPVNTEAVGVAETRPLPDRPSVANIVRNMGGGVRTPGGQEQPRTTGPSNTTTVPPAPTIPGPSNTGGPVPGVPGSASSTAILPGGDVQRPPGTQAPETTGGQDPFASFDPPSPVEPGHPGLPPTSTAPVQPPGALGRGPSPYNDAQDPPRPGTQGSQIPQPSNREGPHRRRRPNPLTQATTETRSQPRTTADAGTSFPPADHSPWHSAQESSGLSPLNTTATSPGSQLLHIPDFGFRRPPGSLRPSSNLNSVGVTLTPPRPSPPATGLPGTRQQSPFTERFSPSRFGWADRRQGEGSTTGASSPVGQQAASQQPGTQLPSAPQPPASGASNPSAPPGIPQTAPGNRADGPSTGNQGPPGNRR